MKLFPNYNRKSIKRNKELERNIINTTIEKVITGEKYYTQGALYIKSQRPFTSNPNIIIALIIEQYN